MSNSQALELTQTQRDVLLRGLRYVRSSIMLDVRDPNPQDEARRSGELQEISQLVDRLNAVTPVDATAGV